VGDLRTRGVIYSAGKDKDEEGSFVAVSGGGKLEGGEAAVFEIRFKHE
jgi:hypothetical protein